MHFVSIAWFSQWVTKRGHEFSFKIRILRKERKAHQDSSSSKTLVSHPSEKDATACITKSRFCLKSFFQEKNPFSIFFSEPARHFAFGLWYLTQFNFPCCSSLSDRSGTRSEAERDPAAGLTSGGEEDSCCVDPRPPEISPPDLGRNVKTLSKFWQVKDQRSFAKMLSKKTEQTGHFSVLQKTRVLHQPTDMLTYPTFIRTQTQTQTHTYTHIHTHTHTHTHTHNLTPAVHALWSFLNRPRVNPPYLPGFQKYYGGNISEENSISIRASPHQVKVTLPGRKPWSRNKLNSRCTLRKLSTGWRQFRSCERRSRKLNVTQNTW